VGNGDGPFMNGKGDPSITIEMVDGEPIEVRNLTFDLNLMEHVPVGTKTLRQKRMNFRFCQFRAAALYRIAEAAPSAELAILTRLYELWFSNFKKNPMKLNAGWFRKLGFERRYIFHALKRLEKSGQIAVERRVGKCPLVTLRKSLLWS
jgi:hypothetical protein